EAGDVHLVRLQRILDRARHRPERRLVEHEVDAAAGARAGLGISNVTLVETETSGLLARHGGERLRDVPLAARGEVVEADDALVEREQMLEEVRADEACAAGQQPGLWIAAEPQAQPLLWRRGNGHLTSA